MRDPDVVASQYDVFVRKARNAARQCLFFLYDLRDLGHYPRSPELEVDAAFALRQTRSLVDGVHIPTRIANAAREGTLDDVPRALPVTRSTWHRLTSFLVERDGEPQELYDLSFRLIGARSRGDRLADYVRNRDSVEHADIQAEAREAILGFWAQRIWSRLHAIEGGFDDAQTREMIVQFQAFLRISRPRGPAEYGTMLVQKLGGLVLRHTALLVGVAALAAIWMQEALASLVLNGGRYSIWPFVLVACGGMVSSAFGLFPKLRLGKSAFLRIAFPAEEPERGIQSWPEACETRRLIGNAEIIKALVMAGWMVLCSFGFWLVADPTQRTLFVLAALSWCVLIALHWFDLWDFLDPRPIRFLVLLGVIMLIAGVLTGWHREAGYVLFGSALAVWGFNTWRTRSASLVSKLMAATSAAILVSLAIGDRTLDRSAWPKRRTGQEATIGVARDGTLRRVGVNEWPFPSHDAAGQTEPIVLLAASGGGSRAAIYTALTLEALHADADLREVAANIQAISSVSGGSLATGAYVAERLRRKRAHASPDDSWRKLVDDVSQDFLYPTLMGALKFGSTRGEEIERYWDEHVGLDGFTLGTLAHAWRTAPRSAPAGTPLRPPFPLPLFNATTLDGHAAVISPLARDVYLDGYDDQSRYRALLDEYHVGPDVELTWVHDRDVVYPLEALSKKANPSLSEAVRASANFPFGFPLVDVRTDQPYGPAWLKKRKKLVSLSDGGVLSNSGLWTLFHLLTHASMEHELKRRGVLLIVIDANKMPVYASDRRNFTSLYGAIKDQDPVGQNMHRNMFELLFQEYDDAIEIVQVDLVPSVADNVRTTWALDVKARKKLRQSFECVWSEADAKAHVRDKIKQAWQSLVARPKEDNAMQPASLASAKQRASAAAMLRPPLD